MTGSANPALIPAFWVILTGSAPGSAAHRAGKSRLYSVCMASAGSKQGRHRVGTGSALSSCRPCPSPTTKGINPNRVGRAGKSRLYSVFIGVGIRHGSRSSLPVRRGGRARGGESKNVHGMGAGSAGPV